jgi:hypothetical protein
VNLNEHLKDQAARRVRLNIIAYETAEEVKCPHCQVGPTTPCVTFLRGTVAKFKHAKRVKARKEQMEAKANAS